MKGKLMLPQLATASVTSRLSNLPGRAIVTARGHHFVVDSPPPLGGPNEEINPIDLLLSALATCGTFVCEKAAQEMSVLLDISGPTQAQAEALVAAFQTRCPVYTTLSRSTPITVEIAVESPLHE